MNAKKGEMIDHRNHNGLDCQRRNLRKCTQSENSMNMVKQRGHKTSAYKGVWITKSIHKGIVYKYWYAGIRVDYKLIHLGSFKTEIEAAHAYDNAARKHFGEFANTNF